MNATSHDYDYTSYHSNHHNKNYDFTTQNIENNGFFSGYASVFDIKDYQGDIIKHGAFADTITHNQNGKNIKLLWQHQQDQPIGKIIHIQENNYGLYIEGQIITEIQRGFEAYSLLKNEAISGLSIGYNVIDYEQDSFTGNRNIYKAELFEISLVTFPANSAANVTSIKSNTDIDHNSFYLHQPLSNAIDKAMQILNYHP